MSLTMETELVLRRYRDVPGFIRTSLRVKRQLKQTKGVEQSRLGANVFRKRFTTRSTWVDDDALQRFIASGAHHRAMGEAPATIHTRFAVLPEPVLNS